MSEAQTLRGRALRIGSLLCVMATVAACTDGQTLGFLDQKATSESTQDTGTTQQAAATGEERDVEAPDVFAAEEAGLWDGRPSLGGVWIAHPDVDEPERVIIRNNANNKEVIGALFRREREIPGPRLQASSDAASALGMLAGAPVELSVVALRRETVEVEPPTSAQVAEAETPAVPEVSEVAETPLDPIADGAAAAIAASEVAPIEEVVAIAADETASADGADATKTESGETSKPRNPRGGFLTALFAGNRNKQVGEPLSALKSEEQRLASAPATVASDATPPAAPPARAETHTSRLDKPFLQIGIFSVEKNANRAADMMRAAGMVPTIHAQKSNDKAFWRVVVGPAQTKSERSALLKQIKGVGFSDAYAVTN
ncbi:MAG: SPOR domain-containing protein [Arenibacterium sp.]